MFSVLHTGATRLHYFILSVSHCTSGSSHNSITNFSNAQNGPKNWTYLLSMHPPFKCISVNQHQGDQGAFFVSVLTWQQFHRQQFHQVRLSCLCSVHVRYHSCVSQLQSCSCLWHTTLSCHLLVIHCCGRMVVVREGGRGVRPHKCSSFWPVSSRYRRGFVQTDLYKMFSGSKGIS